jgi:hypothetical protein
MNPCSDIGWCSRCDRLWIVSSPINRGAVPSTRQGKVAFMLPRPPHTQKLVSSFLDLPKLRLTNALQAKESLVPPETRRFFSALLVIGLLVPARTGRLSTIDPLPFLTPLVVVLSSPTRHPQVQTSLRATTIFTFLLEYCDTRGSLLSKALTRFHQGVFCAVQLYALHMPL